MKENVRIVIKLDTSRKSILLAVDSQSRFPVLALKLFNILPSHAKLLDRIKFNDSLGIMASGCRVLLH